MQMDTKIVTAKKINIIIFMIIFILNSSACQKTPEKNVVQNKDDFTRTAVTVAISSETNNSEGDDSDIVPNMYTGEIQRGSLAVHFNSRVIGTDSISTRNVEPLILTQEIADMIMNELIGEEKIYPHRSNGSILYTKEFYLSEITELKKLLNDSEFIKDTVAVNNVKNEISFLEERMESAIGEDSLIPIDKTFSQFVTPNITIQVEEEDLARLDKEEKEKILKEVEEANNSSGKKTNDEIIEGNIHLGKNQHATLNIFKAEDPIYSSVMFTNQSKLESMVITTPGLMEEITDELLQDSRIAEALSLSQKTIANMNLENYIFSSAGYSTSSFENTTSSEKSDETVFSFFFVPAFEDIKNNYISNEQIFSLDNLDADSATYEKTWMQEFIQIDVNESGILRFHWNAPSETGSVVQENIPLLSFSKIVQISEQQFVNRYAFPEETVEKTEIHITEISMNMMKRKEKDAENYIYVPVWNFIGYTNNVYMENSQYILDENGQHLEKYFRKSFLTLNAIDGSVINL